MSKDEILEGNKLIAEFMGGIYKSNLFEINRGWMWLPVHNMCKISSLQYNCSWDWLMPVIEKIEENYYTEIMGTNTKNDNSYVMNIFDYNGKFILDTHSHSSKLELIFITVVDFIKWHNQNKLNETN